MFKRPRLSGTSWFVTCKEPVSDLPLNVAYLMYCMLRATSILVTEIPRRQKSFSFPSLCLGWGPYPLSSSVESQNFGNAKIDKLNVFNPLRESRALFAQEPIRFCVLLGDL